MKELILDNPELMNELETKIRTKIKDDQNALLDPIGAADVEADDEELVEA